MPCGCISQAQVEPALYGVSWISGTAGIGFAAQAKLARFESAGASALHTLPLGSNLGDATETQGIGF